MKQGIYEESATPKYPIGTRIYQGGVFRYCRAVTALTPHWGARNTDTLHELLDTFAAYDAGVTTITLVVDGIEKDQFKDGYLNIHTAPYAQICLRIKGNDATVGANTTFYLKDPLLYDTPLATDCDLHANIYNNVGTFGGGEALSSVVCIPLIPVTINQYFWGQTWGPIAGVAHAGGGVGAGADERSVWFWIDGSIGALAQVNNAGEQMAGFMLPDTTIGADLFFMLQLAP